MIWLAVGMVLALALRLVGIDFGLPLQLHPDEWSQIETALKMQTGDLNPHFFRYPSLFMYQLVAIDGAVSLFSAASGWTIGASSYFLLGRILSAVYGSLTVGAIFLLGRAVVNETVGLLSAFLLAISPEHIRQSHYATVDIEMTLLCVLALAFAFQAIKEKRLDVVPTGVAIGLAMGAKYSAIFILPPLLGLFTWKLARLAPPNQSWVSDRKIALIAICIGAITFVGLTVLPVSSILALLKSWTTDGTLKPEYLALFNTVLGLGRLAAIGALLLGTAMWWNEHLRAEINKLAHSSLLIFGISIIITFIITSPYILLDIPHAARDILYEYRHISLGGLAQFRTDDPIVATLTQPPFFPEPNFYWDWLVAQNGWILLAVALVGVGILFRKNRPAFFVLGLIAIVLAFVLTRAANKGERYALLFVPLLSLWAGAGLASLIQSHITRTRPIFQTAIVLVVAGISLLSTYSVLYREFILPDTRVLTFHWIEQNLPSGSTLVREFNTPDMEHASSQYNIIETTSAFESRSLDDWQKVNVKFILVGPIREWYRQNAEFYPRTVENYLMLDRQASLIQKFQATDQSSGPTIWIYKLP